MFLSIWFLVSGRLSGNLPLCSWKNFHRGPETSTKATRPRVGAAGDLKLPRSEAGWFRRIFSWTKAPVVARCTQRPLKLRKLYESCALKCFFSGRNLPQALPTSEVLIIPLGFSYWDRSIMKNGYGSKRKAQQGPEVFHGLFSILPIGFLGYCTFFWPIAKCPSCGPLRRSARRVSSSHRERRRQEDERWAFFLVQGYPTLPSRGW